MKNREIKFRAWNSDLNKYSNPFTFNSTVLNFTNDKGFGTIKSITDELIEQFTGLHDKNGVEIYEGDILSWGYGYTDEVVTFENGCFGYSSLYSFTSLSESNLVICEVIGNIHENPELLS